jgi:hypothetical protein
MTDWDFWIFSLTSATLAAFISIFLTFAMVSPPLINVKIPCQKTGDV